MNTVKISPHSADAVYRELIAAHGSPLLILDPAKASIQYRALERALPDADFYYAVKSLPHPAMLNRMANMGAGFDVASTGEIELIRDLPMSSRRTIYTHPIKRDSDIRTALRSGCTTFVVDNSDEMLKFLPYRHRVGLMLRISFRSDAAVVDLSKKFGCAVQDVPQMLNLAVQLGIHVKGLSFHVGSQCTNAQQHVAAIDTCNTLIRQHHDAGAAPISLLDIGSGFPVAYDGTTMDIDRYCAPIRKALAALPTHTSVIVEPGRFISAPAMICVTSV
ncbi:MAG: type III PLP-dependent enzyme, partial [Deltaproteobacteria bacterium]|nr:type III PLP-dependent enzyme [Deltaproteobacteria bacterium]